MYNLIDIKEIHLEITSKCQASCPMCPRRLQGGPIMPWVKLTEISFDKFKEWFNIDFVKQLKKLNMCGNLGDPIIAKDTHLIFEYLRDANIDIELQMHTNGSARDMSFWQDLARLQVFVVFGIDGLTDTHSRYRIGTNFDQIINNAETFISAGGNARWDMLVFDHNKHQVKICEEMAYDLGFKEFKKKNSSRFKDGKYHVLNEQGQTIDILYPTEKSKEHTNKVLEAQSQKQSIIKCKAKENQQIYIAANGIVSPCCWLDTSWMPPINLSRIDYMDKIGIYPNLHDNTLEEIFSSNFFRDIYSTWNNSTCLVECKKQCGSFDKLGAQFES